MFWRMEIFCVLRVVMMTCLYMLSEIHKTVHLEKVTLLCANYTSVTHNKHTPLRDNFRWIRIMSMEPWNQLPKWNVECVTLLIILSSNYKDYMQSPNKNLKDSVDRVGHKKRVPDSCACPMTHLMSLKCLLSIFLHFAPGLPCSYLRSLKSPVELHWYNSRYRGQDVPIGRLR